MSKKDSHFISHLINPKKDYLHSLDFKFHRPSHHGVSSDLLKVFKLRLFFQLPVFYPIRQLNCFYFIHLVHCCFNLVSLILSMLSTALKKKISWWDDKLGSLANILFIQRCLPWIPWKSSFCYILFH